MNLLVTGAGGYLGAAVADMARARGHAVREIRRGPASGDVVVADLAQGLPEGALDGIDAVIHCAAKLTGDDAAMARDTIAATRLLAQALAARGIPMVLAGSVSVYDGMAGPVVTEATPLETRPALRDAYTRAKIAQEAAAGAGQPLRILRIGALWGRGQLWNAHLGQGMGPVFWRMGNGEIPLAHVDHAALALILAAEQPWQGEEVINVIDDDRPDAVTYLAALPQKPARIVGLPFGLIDGVARALAPFGARLPGLLRRPVLHARMAPRRYDNARLHRLGWRPLFTFVEGIRNG